jgi:hypothetical protein
VRDGVGDGGRGAIERHLADSLGSGGAARVRIFLEEDADGRNVP